MKRIIAIILVFAALACLLCGCGKAKEETVIINGKEYKTGFYGDMAFTGDESYMTDEFVDPYCRLNVEGHDWWLDGWGFVYCPVEDFEAEKEYYASEENLGVFVTFGEFSNPLDTLQITSIDEKKVDSLLKFSAKHVFDPEKPDKKNGQVECPQPESHDAEVHFYRGSTDGMFTRGKEDTYYMINNYLLKLYYYLDDNMYVIQVPDDPADYFVELLNDLGGFSLES